MFLNSCRNAGGLSISNPLRLGIQAGRWKSLGAVLQNFSTLFRYKLASHDRLRFWSVYATLRVKRPGENFRLTTLLPRGACSRFRLQIVSCMEPPHNSVCKSASHQPSSRCFFLQASSSLVLFWFELCFLKRVQAGRTQFFENTLGQFLYGLHCRVEHPMRPCLDIDA